MELSQRLIDAQLLIRSVCLAKKRLLLPVIIFSLLLTQSTHNITISVLADAFWQVSAYVAASLTVYHYLANFISQYKWLVNVHANNSKYQVVAASFMGAIPGCGGAIIIITQFVQGRLSFGAVVAVLTATMGDAAFLLLASQPGVGLFVIAIGVVVGVISGWCVDLIHGDTFMRQEVNKKAAKPCCHQRSDQGISAPIKLQGVFWQYMLVPSGVIAILFSFQVNVDKFLHLEGGTIDVIGAGAAIITMILWSLSREVSSYESFVSEDLTINTRDLFQKVAQDTNFVTSWVILAFLVFELFIFFSGVDLDNVFSQWGNLTPMLAILIGLLPGCGPQIMTTSLYLSGTIPLSAQLGNAISNDGDALFPAIAMAPKMAIIATLYSAIPAIIVAYGYLLLFE